MLLATSSWWLSVFVPCKRLTTHSALSRQEGAISQVHGKLDAYRKLILGTSERLRKDLETLARLYGPPKKAGFLASKVMPVDGFKIRNSLFLSVCPCC